MSLLDRIANYFKEWDGIDKTAPKMELSIHDLRYIADMNVERCRLIRQLNEANFKTEEIRNKAIDEFAERLKKEYKPCKETDTEIYQAAKMPPNIVIVPQTNVLCQRIFRHKRQFLHLAPDFIVHFVQHPIL